MTPWLVNSIIATRNRANARHVLSVRRVEPDRAARVTLSHQLKSKPRRAAKQLPGGLLIDEPRHVVSTWRPRMPR